MHESESARMSNDNSRKKDTEQDVAVALLSCYIACNGAKWLNGIVAAICVRLCVEVAAVRVEVSA